jgi:hypothetical protein
MTSSAAPGPAPPGRCQWPEDRKHANSSHTLMRWLGETEPDVACLQELKASDEKFPELAIRKAGYRAVWHGQKSWKRRRDTCA